MKSLLRLLLPFLAGGCCLPVISQAVLADAPESVHPLDKGKPAPSALIATSDGKEVELSSVVANQPTILIFYRGGWCPFCNRHLAALGEIYVDLRKLGFQIVAVSPDNFEAMTATIEKQHLLYKLYSDRALRLSSLYGVAYRISAETSLAYKGNGIELPPVPDSKDSWLPVPTAFVINRAGQITFVYFNPDPSIRISGEEILKAAAEAVGQTLPQGK